MSVNSQTGPDFGSSFQLGQFDSVKIKKKKNLHQGKPANTLSQQYAVKRLNLETVSAQTAHEQGK